MQPQLPQTEKQRKEHEQWQKASEQGPILYVATAALIPVAIDVFLRMAEKSGHWPKWLSPRGPLSTEEVVIDTVTGLILGAWEWSRMQSKFTARDAASRQTTRPSI